MLLYARMPQVSRLFLGVAHDGGYHHPLSTLINEGLVEKIVLLRSFVEELPLDLRDLRLAEGRLDGLFLVNKLHTPRRSRNTSLPPTPKMNPAQGGHRRSDSVSLMTLQLAPAHELVTSMRQNRRTGPQPRIPNSHSQTMGQNCLKPIINWV